jgi:predicted transcriptional regulator
MNEVTIGIQSLAGAKARLAEAMRGKAQGRGARIDFATPELLWRVLAPNRLAILRAMNGAGPLALREIARRVGRDVKGVHTDVHALLQAGILDRVDEGFVFPFDAVHIDFTLKVAA